MQSATEPISEPLREKAALTQPAGNDRSSPRNWSPSYSYVLLAALTVVCLLPFSGRAFHVDDTLFLWAAQHIAQHPLDPYRFDVVWDLTRLPMSEVTKNPPLASYYAALVASAAGWSEPALHLAFLIPALAVILGTYHLARQFTESPLIAAAATLLTPAFLVSSISVMCDTMMLAFWIWAILFWTKGLATSRPHYFVISSLLISASALTKYFGVALIPLLLVYPMVRRDRVRVWAGYLLIPVLMLVAYQFWTKGLYGQGLLLNVAGFSANQRSLAGQTSVLGNALAGLSFLGGCVLPAIFLAPVSWPWKEVLVGAALGLAAGFSVALGWVQLGNSIQTEHIRLELHRHWMIVGAQLAVYIAAGFSVLALAVSDYMKRRDAASLLLGLWVCGTFVFAAFLNWTINARSILPLIPAAGILLARRLDGAVAAIQVRKAAIIALVASACLSIWIAQADSAWANSARRAAATLHERTRNETGTIWFQGHWGFQYYMESYGARPVDFANSVLSPGDMLIIPENNIETLKFPSELIASSELLEIDLHQHVSTMRWPMGAGFYSSFWGPLPFAFGRVPTERYFLFRIARPVTPGNWRYQQ
jgi:Dolichyl-phosphate-mannose-protein mannosyltransferase